VQDVLADPPFSRLDLVSCRNLLIYLRPEAQAKVVSAFHFALREGGLLLLGSSETVGNTAERFAIVSKAARVYRHIGRSRNGDFGFSRSASNVQLPLRLTEVPPPSHASEKPARVSELELELEATRTELEGAIHNREISGEEQKAINEEALSANEEFQSTNEELLTSKEELQSLNEELTALNTQLQETLERQRTTSNDLQNILYSTMSRGSR
jgi:hypothetical protein